MTRQIKFRAWDKEKKQITYLDDEYVSEALHYAKQGTHILMQFTGLLDKNGKEIYEGDIVDCIGAYDLKGEIVFERYVTDNEANEDMFGWCLSTPKRFYAFDPQCSMSFEIIGNIYENPELLNN